MSERQRTDRVGPRGHVTTDKTSPLPRGDKKNDYVNVRGHPDALRTPRAPPPLYACVHPGSGGEVEKQGPPHGGVTPRSAGQARTEGGRDPSVHSPRYASISPRVRGKSATGLGGPAGDGGSGGGGGVGADVAGNGTGGAGAGGDKGAFLTDIAGSGSPSVSPRKGGRAVGKGTGSDVAPAAIPKTAASSAAPSSGELAAAKKATAGPTPEGRMPRHACLLPKLGGEGGARATPGAGGNDVVTVESGALPPPPSSPARRPDSLVRPEVTAIPSTNIGVAIMVLLCFNFPLGLAAVCLSLSATKAYRDGQKKSGHQRARLSIILSLVGIVVTVLVVMTVVLHMALSKQAKSTGGLPTRRGYGF